MRHLDDHKLFNLRGFSLLRINKIRRSRLCLRKTPKKSFFSYSYSKYLRIQNIQFLFRELKASEPSFATTLNLKVAKLQGRMPYQDQKTKTLGINQSNEVTLMCNNCFNFVSLIITNTYPFYLSIFLSFFFSIVFISFLACLSMFFLILTSLLSFVLVD